MYVCMYVCMYVYKEAYTFLSYTHSLGYLPPYLRDSDALVPCVVLMLMQ